MLKIVTDPVQRRMIEKLLLEEEAMFNPNNMMGDAHVI